MDKMYTCINGEFVPFEHSYVHVSDLIIQRGFGIFDFFLVKEGVPAYISYHLDRFIKSAVLMNLELAWTKEELTGMVIRLTEKNAINNSSVKIMLTGGISNDDFTLLPGKSTLIIINKPFEIKLPEAWKNGGCLITANYQREIPEAKTINYIRSVKLSRKLMEESIAEVLYISRKWVRECSRSNIFCVKDGIVYTPKSNILEGVTRRRILESEGYNLQVKDFKISDLLAADEVFITSTTKGVLPVIKIDSHVIADGRIGAVTKAVLKLIMG
ncbi:MAG TPA: aminotransferase class IV [Prolixibacteraceae bacterium]|nr:aminotransferase class IV [Prolixibacteraceae bacterium]